MINVMWLRFADGEIETSNDHNMGNSHLTNTNVVHHQYTSTCCTNQCIMYE